MWLRGVRTDPFQGKRSKNGSGFTQPLAPHEHWHIDVSYLKLPWHEAVMHGDRKRTLSLDTAPFYYRGTRIAWFFMSLPLPFSLKLPSATKSRISMFLQGVKARDPFGGEGY
jgi:hypothetical protein